MKIKVKRIQDQSLFHGMSDAEHQRKIANLERMHEVAEQLIRSQSGWSVGDIVYKPYDDSSVPYFDVETSGDFFSVNWDADESKVRRLFQRYG